MLRRSYLAVLGTAAALLFAVGAGAVARRPDSIQVMSELSTKGVRNSESNLASVIADALRAVEKSDIAFLAASAFSEITIAKGTATTEDVLKALTFRTDTVVIVKLTGTQIKKALEHGLATYPQKNLAFLQVSGITVNINASAEANERVEAIKVGGRPLDNNKTYTVAMNSPLANGALVYFKVWSKSDIDHDTNKALDQAITDYLSSQKTLGSKNEERLIFKK